MNERLQYAVLSETLQVVTRLTQSITSADCVTDAESLANEMISAVEKRLTGGMRKSDV